MKTTYITLALISIILIFLIFIYFIDIPSPGRILVEPYNLEIK